MQNLLKLTLTWDVFKLDFGNDLGNKAAELTLTWDVFKF